MSGGGQGRGGFDAGRGELLQEGGGRGVGSGPNDVSRKIMEGKDHGVHLKPCSFRDKVTGGAPPVQVNVPDDLLSQKLAVLDWMDGDRLAPRVSFDESIIKEFSQPWKDALVVKLLGRSIGFLDLKER